ncbi:MAG: hypothetical protein ACM4D3_20405, partial [Candidatus Sericytochromatia bacterium]
PTVSAMARLVVARLPATKTRARMRAVPAPEAITGARAPGRRVSFTPKECTSPFRCQRRTNTYHHPERMKKDPDDDEDESYSGD